jgi:hypothetical protein
MRLQTRETTDFSPETKRLIEEARKTNFGRPPKAKPAAPKKTQAEEFREAKGRLMETVPDKREQKLIDLHLRRAAELEKAGNPVEAALQRELAETARKNGIAIREVFAENIARHEKEISENLAKPIEVIRAERKAKDAAKTERMKTLLKKQQAKKKGTK